MRWDELRTRCINACTLYIDKVRDKRGVASTEYEVRAISKVPGVNNQYVLLLDKRVFDLDRSVLIINDNFVSGYKFLRQVSSKKGRAIYYEVAIEVHPNEELNKEYHHCLAALNAEGWKISSSMLFLIERVRQFYQDCNTPLFAPKLAPLHPILFQRFEKYHLDKYQFGAINMIFREPLSFVWGPPGSGKTKCVLAAAVEEYVCSGDNVLIVTPTNNSIELCLRGLIKATELHPEQFFREGVATEEFTDEFPMCCNGRDISQLQSEYNKLSEDCHKKAQDLEKAQQYVKELENQHLKQLDKYNRSFLLRNKEKEALGRIEYRLRVAKTMVEDIKKGYIEAEERKLIKEHEILEKSYQRETDLPVQVRACTLDYFINNSAQFDNLAHIFVDEAAYAHAIKVLPLFSKRVPITLLGDIMQLSPIYEFNTSEIYYDNLDLWLWTVRSVFCKALTDERLPFNADMLAMWDKDTGRYINGIDMPLMQLRYTYRYGQRLADVLSEFIYKKYGMEIYSNVRGDVELYHLQVPYSYDKHTNVNQLEKDVVSRLEDAIDCMVLTPYRKQKTEHGLTVHKSQGEEYDVVVFSPGRVYNEKGGHFVDSTNFQGASLLNTAISRAKRVLVIVTDRCKWENAPNQLITQLIDNAQSVCFAELVELIEDFYNNQRIGTEDILSLFDF